MAENLEIKSTTGSEASIARTSAAFSCFSPSQPSDLMQKRRQSISQNAAKPSRASMCALFSDSKDKSEKKKKETPDKNENVPLNNQTNISPSTQSSCEDWISIDNQDDDMAWKQNPLRRRSKRRQTIMLTKTSSSPAIMNKEETSSSVMNKKKRPNSAVKIRSSLLAATASSLRKSRSSSTDTYGEDIEKHQSAFDKRTQVEKPPTKPVSPQFKLRVKPQSSDRLNSEQRALELLKVEREKRDAVMRKTKLYYEKLMKQREIEKRRTSSESSAVKRRRASICSVARAAGLGRRKSLGAGRDGSALPVSATKIKRMVHREWKLQQQRMINLSTPRSAPSNATNVASEPNLRRSSTPTTIKASRLKVNFERGRICCQKSQKIISSEKKLTIAQPFTLRTEQRSNVTKKNTEKCLTAAELAKKFIEDTRSHKVPKQAAKQLTMAHSPQLKTTKRFEGADAVRARPLPLSTEEREEKEMENIRQNGMFKARPLDRRIFSSTGELGVPKVRARPTTEPREFQLKVDRRMAHYPRNSAASISADHEEYKFRARPMPDYAKEAAKHRAVAPCVHEKKLTIPLSPKFGKDGKIRSSSAPPRRQRRPVAEEKREQELKETKKFQRQLTITHPEPFVLRTSQRGEIYQKAFIDHVEHEWEMELQQRECHAQPAPDFSKRSNNGIKQSTAPPVPTEPKPFQLRSEARHSEYQQHEAMRIAAQRAMEEDRKRRETFHARPLPKTTFEPQIVGSHSNDACPLLPLKVELESEKRAKKREEFDSQMREKLANLEKMKTEMKEKKKKEEEQLIHQLRHKSVEDGGFCFKAVAAPSRKSASTIDNVNPPPPPSLERSPLMPFKNGNAANAKHGAAKGSLGPAIRVKDKTKTKDVPTVHTPGALSPSGLANALEQM